MIRELFIPDVLGDYYVGTQAIVGFDISRTHVYATYVRASGRTIVIEKCYTQMIDQDTDRPWIDRAAQALLKMSPELPRGAHIRVSCSSSQIMYKEVSLPFADPKKIDMVIGYELEPSLPFLLSAASYDFIITDRTLQGGVSLLVALAQKSYFQEFYDLFARANIVPDAFTADLFDMYGLFKVCYPNQGGNVALVDIGATATHIAFITQGRLRFVRTLNQGVVSAAKIVSQELGVSIAQAVEMIVRFGFEPQSDEAYKSAFIRAISSYWDSVQFTLDSFMARTTPGGILDAVLLLGGGSQISGMPDFVKQKMNVACQRFDCASLMKRPAVATKVHPLPGSHLVSLATALPLSPTYDVNLQKDASAPAAVALFARQAIVAASLVALTLCALLFHSYWQFSRLRAEIAGSTNQLVSYLNKAELTDKKRLEQALEEARDKVAQEEKIWFAFSGATRFSFLTYLQALSSRIDREALGLVLKRMVITENDITLEGEITKGFDALKLFEKELRDSHLFDTVPNSPNLKFGMKLTLVKPEGAS